jgi:hypothetical protein
MVSPGTVHVKGCVVELHGGASVRVRAFDSSPFEGLPPVGECAHLGGLAVTEGEYVSEARVVPYGAVSKPHPRVNEHNNLVAGDNEPLRLAAPFGPVRARLRQVRLDSCMSVIRPAAWKLPRLDPLNLGIEGLHGCRNIVPVEGRVGFLQPLGLSRKRRCHRAYICLLPSLVAGAQNPRGKGQATT